MDFRRLLLILVFASSSIMLWDAWQKHNAPPPVANGATQAASTVPSSSGLASDVPQPTAPSVAASEIQPSVSAAPAAPSGEVVRITTDLMVADVSTVGGELVRLEFLKHSATENAQQNLVFFGPDHRYAAQSGLIGDGLPNHRAMYRVLPGPRDLGDQKQIVLRLETDGPAGITVAKTLTFERGQYTVKVAHELVNKTEQAVSGHAYYQFQRDGRAPEGESSMMITYTGPAIYTETEKYQKVSFDDLAKGKAKFATRATDGWTAMVQHYFVGAWLPAPGVDREFYARKLDGDLYSSGVIVPFEAVAPGATGRFEQLLYAGPQEQATLKALAPGLDLVVDYGWLHIIAAPIFWLLQLIHGWVGNWGWAIIWLTVAIKAVFYPLSAASYKSMAKMKAVTPRLMALKERYGDDRQRMNQEMMEIYRKEKINPLGGCLPILVQIPVFIALYWVLLGAVEMRGAPWLGWITDLSAQDPYYILPVIMVISMVIQTRLNPTPPDPIQAKIMMAMPFVFGVMFLWFPAGLVLYWVVNNILSIAQQWQITRLIERGAKV